MLAQLLKDALFGSPPVRFESHYGLDESVARLAAATSRPTMFPAMTERAVGRISAKSVTLHHHVPLMRNAFRPMFRGQFEQVGKRVVLTGQFSVHWLTRLFTVMWIGFATLGAAAMLIEGKQGDATVIFVPLAGVGLLTFSVWWARNDPAWLSNLIRNALGGERSDVQMATDHRTILAGEVTATRRWAWATGVAGALHLMSAWADVYPSPGLRRLALAPFADDRLRFGAAIVGIVLLWLASGIYQRKEYAWQFGFVGLAAMLLFQAGLWAAAASSAEPWAVVVPWLFGLMGGAVWGRWWYQQKKLFPN
ncbi:putative membrane protein [Luteibacter sp. Sphag1AF]|uniref:hypothetical protein n=1 Tax=Luteibacter sp. Sphag1AF TaxID=2587031 RepID=UPI00161ED1DA|nr:hypothetical protein [Luteibacter sp. Sphag1AF]MBB3228525.1 putative membrane protein [Luteibacter sp. Sphag1AF]